MVLHNLEQVAEAADFALEAAYVAWKKAGGEGDFDTFTRKTFESQNQRRAAREQEITKAGMESREANKRCQILGPQIVEEEYCHSQLVGEGGPPITDPANYVAPCGHKLDSKREAELLWESMNGANISIPTEPELRKFVSSQLYQPGVTRGGLYCHHEVETWSEKFGRAVLGSAHKTPCGNRILRDYRILPLEAKRR